MSRTRPPKSAKGNNRRVARLEAEVVQLRQQLATAQAVLLQVEQGGVDAFFARRLAQLEEGQQVARGQALEAAAARSRAEGADAAGCRGEGAGAIRVVDAAGKAEAGPVIAATSMHDKDARGTGVRRRKPSESL